MSFSKRIFTGNDPRGWLSQYVIEGGPECAEKLNLDHEQQLYWELRFEISFCLATAFRTCWSLSKAEHTRMKQIMMFVSGLAFLFTFETCAAHIANSAGGCGLAPLVDSRILRTCKRRYDLTDEQHWEELRQSDPRLVTLLSVATERELERLQLAHHRSSEEIRHEVRISCKWMSGFVWKAMNMGLEERLAAAQD